MKAYVLALAVASDLSLRSRGLSHIVLALALIGGRLLSLLAADIESPVR